MGSFMSNSMKEIQKKCSTRDAYDETRILLGNSATSSNRHQQMFDMLERFNKENAVFYAPLTYGDMEYRDKIIKLGKDKFGDKFVPLVKHMDSSDYLDFLSTITVGVFNHNRQQGIGNISRLLAFGAKVYLSKDGPLLEENLKDGFKVFPTEDIPNQSFEELIFMKDKDRETNTQKASFEAYSQEAKELWSKIIAYLNVVKPYERS